MLEGCSQPIHELIVPPTAKPVNKKDLKELREKLIELLTLRAYNQEQTNKEEKKED